MPYPSRRMARPIKRAELLEVTVLVSRLRRLLMQVVGGTVRRQFSSHIGIMSLPVCTYEVGVNEDGAPKVK
jgi:hypothetical protein